MFLKLSRLFSLKVLRDLWVVSDAVTDTVSDCFSPRWSDVMFTKCWH